MLEQILTVSCWEKLNRNQSPDLGFPGGTSAKEPACQCRRHKRRGFDPWVGKIPWRWAWQPTPVFLTEESPGTEDLASYSPQAYIELDTNEVT